MGLHQLSGFVNSFPWRLPDALDRLLLRAQIQLEERWLPAPRYEILAWEEAVVALERHAGLRLSPYLLEDELREVEAQVSEGQRRTAAPDSLRRGNDGHFTLGRASYALARALRPRIVVETGVAHGVSSAFLLAALHRNGNGALHSVDRPARDPDARQLIGSLVPDGLRGRWHLHEGLSRGTLPRLLPSLAPVDLFVHDSRHTYWNMAFEFRQARRYLNRPGAVLADDVECNRAFERWIRRAGPEAWAAVRQDGKRALLGVAVFASER